MVDYIYSPRAVLDERPSTPLADELEGITKQVQQAIWNANAAIQRLDTLRAGADPTLPAPLTEDAIVAALKADPAMAGRVMGRYSREGMASDISAAGGSAYQWCGDDMTEHGLRSARLQSLAVALAAASYRG